MDVTELELFGRMQDLMREEAELLAIPAEARTPEQHARLAAIGLELDRMWEALRARAQREPQANVAP
jgi:hypothetical protein